MEKLNKNYFHRVRDYTHKTLDNYPIHKDQIINMYYSLMIDLAKNTLNSDKIQNFYRQVETLKLQ